MAAIDEARCQLCNRPWPLRARACPVFDGESPIEHEWMIPLHAIEAVFEGHILAPIESTFTDDFASGIRSGLFGVRRELLGDPEGEFR